MTYAAAHLCAAVFRFRSNAFPEPTMASAANKGWKIGRDAFITGI